MNNLEFLFRNEVGLWGNNYLVDQNSKIVRKSGKFVFLFEKIYSTVKFPFEAV